jgi:class 3 adenylate cyclase
VPIGIVVAIICVILQNSSELIPAVFQPEIQFVHTSHLEYHADLKSLNPGHYFISVGRPRGPCDIMIDGKRISTTRSSEVGLRSRLALGADFSVSTDSAPQEIIVKCEDEVGFSSGFTHTPLILRYYEGQATQVLREVTTLFLGPLASLFLLILVLSASRQSSVQRFFSTSLPYLGFAAIALMYGTSLSHFPRLFLAANVASIVHWILRASFSFGFYWLVAHHTRWSWPIALAHVVPLIGLCHALTSDPSRFDSIYDSFYVAFPILALFATSQLYQETLKTRSAVFLRYIGSAWIFTQLVDVGVLYINKGPYTAPAAVVLMTLGVAYLRREAILRYERIDASNSSVLQLISGAGPVDIKLKAVGSLVQQHIHYKRYSTYVDAYVVGMYDRPYERFIRLAEGGYDKDTSADKEISFSDGRGIIMQQALSSQSPQLGYGKDHAWYSVIPLGQHAVLNLSDDRVVPHFLAAESHEFMVYTLPALKMLNESLTEFGARMSYALEVLRLIRGDGTWTEEIGCIFLDANNFADGLEKFGEPFGRFITTKYLPSLCKRVRRWAVREGNAAGDAVYLICIHDLMQDQCTPAQAVYNAIEEILNFVDTDGAQMCIAQGFPAVRLQIGASAGMASLICDDFQVRTSGKVVVEAARLQKSGQPGQTLVNADLAHRWPKDGALTVDAPFAELKKTRRLNACRVYLKKRAA